MKDLWLLLFIVYKLSVKLLFKLKLIKGVQYGLIGFVVGKDQSDAILVGRNRDAGNAVGGFDFFVGVGIFLKLIELYGSIVIFFASCCADHGVHRFFSSCQSKSFCCSVDVFFDFRCFCFLGFVGRTAVAAAAAGCECQKQNHGKKNGDNFFHSDLLVI